MAGFIDHVAFTSIGVYSETYGSADKSNRANLYASLGLLEDAPEESIVEALGKALMELGLATTLK